MVLGFTELAMPLILFAIVYELFWKAAKNDQKGWFIAMLVTSTVGILPLLYIFLFQKGRKGL